MDSQDSPQTPPPEPEGLKVRLPQPDELTEREKEDAMASYLMMFASWAIGLPLPLFNLIASVVYYAVTKKSSRFAAFHALQSLLTQVPVSCLNAGLVGWLIGILVTTLTFPRVFFVYLIFTALVNVVYIAYSIIALIRARKGLFYYMPWFGRVAFGRFYGPGAEAPEKQKQVLENRPPEGF